MLPGCKMSFDHFPLTNFGRKPIKTRDMSAQSSWPIKLRGSKKESKSDSGRPTKVKGKDGNRNGHRKSSAESLSKRKKEGEETAAQFSRETVGHKSDSSPRRRLGNFMDKFNPLKKRHSPKHEFEAKSEKKKEKSESRQRSPPVDTGLARSPPAQNDDYDKPTVFERIGTPIRPCVSKPKRKKTRKSEVEADVKTGRTEGDTSTSRADSDIRTAHGEDEISRHESSARKSEKSVKKQSEKSVKKRGSKAEEVKGSGNKEGESKERATSVRRTESKEKNGSKASLKKVESKENVKKEEKKSRKSEESDVKSVYVQDTCVTTPKKKPPGKRPEYSRSEEFYREEYAKSEYVEEDQKTYEEKPKPKDDSSKNVKSCYLGYYK
ncbi:unnamed protein product [Bursaphelenchus xylophilus]|uniref:(pine wood nematode) hypothetical protein n=1 Tax=Bursaphelenchus xylophilus TaxID=6326 RepID=A0A1I7S9E3_BURXY|nr:unnamed protein product [Bursaphelenchus xylophilus]CAG9100557.1 unnamed protein product [Bursaphelenchus xylophilus]